MGFGVPLIRLSHILSKRWPIDDLSIQPIQIPATVPIRYAMISPVVKAVTWSRA